MAEEHKIVTVTDEGLKKMQDRARLSGFAFVL